KQLVSIAAQRYDSFLAAIINNGSLPINVKILSWNYDFQFEKAYSEYTTNNSSLESLQIALKVFPSKMNDFNYEPKNFCIYKINGTTSFKTQENEIVNPTDDIAMNSGKFMNLIPLIYDRAVNQKSLLPTLQFAWEKSSLSQKTIETAKADIAKTEILVVIGYSFPFFNREVDKQLLASMKPKKVYFQAPTQEVKNYPSRYLAVSGHKTEFIEIDDLSQFYLPAEL
ncbi:MAG: hypothetical protein AB1728_15480, partial [Bacteroidota bacterium]